MNRETFAAEAAASRIPGIVLQRLPEDESQALCHITWILSLNDDPAIKPGQLYGMSRVLAHATRVWDDLQAGSDQP